MTGALETRRHRQRRVVSVFRTFACRFVNLSRQTIDIVSYTDVRTSRPMRPNDATVVKITSGSSVVDKKLFRLFSSAFHVERFRGAHLSVDRTGKSRVINRSSSCDVQRRPGGYRRARRLSKTRPSRDGQRRRPTVNRVRFRELPRADVFSSRGADPR